MFESFGSAFRSLNEFLKFAKDEHFRKFFTHPKVQALLKNEKFKSAVEERNMFALMGNSEFVQALEDPEIRSALEEMRMKFEKKD